ncbi:MAG: monooxygenase FAD-binding protein [Herminiimonas sp.]|nr:monooxygenase FAD-binding protein [Herminiimonas sp.]
MVETPVLIVGGGLAGATLAAELGFRGGSCLLVEQNAGENPHLRANMAGQRTMEVFRRWGLADKVLNASLPRYYPVNVVFSIRLNGQELHRFSLPSIAEFQDPESALRAELPDVDYSPYFKTQIGQNFLEPVIREFAASFPGVQVRQGWQLVEFSQDKEGVIAQILNPASGVRETVKDSYLVACDGGRSIVTKSLGVSGMDASFLARH